MRKAGIVMPILALMLLFTGCCNALLGSLPEELEEQPNILPAFPVESIPDKQSDLQQITSIVLPPATLPKVIVQINKITEEGFEGVVTESADSYLQKGEQVQVVYDWSKCAEADRRSGVVTVIFSDFCQKEGADLLLAESISFNHSPSPLFDTKRTVNRIAVSSLPESYSYEFTNVEGRTQIISYLSDLDLTADFSENPNEYSGMTWMITLYFADGTSTTIYHFGNMFIRAEGEPWYKMDYEQGNKFDEIVWNLPPEC